MSVAWEHPAALLIPLALAPIAWLARQRRSGSVYFSELALLERVERWAESSKPSAPWPTSWRLRLVWLPSAVRVLWLLLLVLALAGPYRPPEPARMPRALAFIVDTSGSMGTVETVGAAGPITRLDQAKRLVETLLTSRLAANGESSARRDFISLVTAAKTPDLIAPVTDEGDLVLAANATLKVDLLDNRTNLGDAIALAIESLRPLRPLHLAPALVLLTDGAHNAPGSLALGEAARIAEALGIPIDVVALGSAATALVPADFERDRASLRRLAALTGGRFVALDKDADLPDRARKLAQLDHAPVPGSLSDLPATRRPLAGPLLVFALALLFLDVLLRATWLRVFPG